MESLEIIFSRPSRIPAIGRSKVTLTVPVPPGGTVAELATVATPHIQPPSAGGIGNASSITKGRPPVLVNSTSFTTCWVALILPKS